MGVFVTRIRALTCDTCPVLGRVTPVLQNSSLPCLTPLRDLSGSSSLS